MMEMSGDVSGIINESGLESAAALRRISLGARLGKLQLPDRAENWELLASFLTRPEEAERKRC